MLWSTKPYFFSLSKQKKGQPEFQQIQLKNWNNENSGLGINDGMGMHSESTLNWNVLERVRYSIKLYLDYSVSSQPSTVRSSTA